MLVRSALCVAALGCAGDPDASPDAGSGLDTGDASGGVECATGRFEGDQCLLDPPRPTPPDLCPSQVWEEGICLPSPPALPTWACPPGWEQATVPLEPETVTWLTAAGQSAPVFCRPPTPAADCAPGTAPRAGQAACVPFGSDCPAAGERWPVEALLRARAESFDGAVRYAAPDGEANGDGSREHPFTSLGAALDAAEDGDIVALAEGDYVEVTRVDRAVALLGACPARTRLLATDSGPAPILDLAADVRVADLTLAGDRRSVRIRRPDTRAELLGIAFWSTADSALLVGATGADIHLRDALLEGGGNLTVTDGRVEIADTTILGANAVAVRVTGPAASVHLDGVLVFGTIADPTQPGTGAGLEVSFGAQAAAVRSAFVGNENYAILVATAGTLLALEDAFIADQVPAPAFPGLGAGIGVLAGARVEIRRAAFAENYAQGIMALEPGTTLAASDLFVLDTRPRQLDDNVGDGLAIADGASAEVTRAVLVGNHQSGAVIDRAAATLADILVAESRPRPLDGALGDGVGIFDGSLSLQRAAILRNHDTGVFARGREARVELVDVLVAETRPRASDGLFGNGLAAYDGARITGRRVSLRGNQEAAAVCHWLGSSIDLSDLLVADTNGRGVLARFGGTIEVERGAWLSNRDVAILAFHNDPAFHGVDVTIRDTLGRPDGGGTGIAAVEGAGVELERFLIEGSELVGVHLVGEGQLRAAGGLITANEIGVNIQVPSFDIATAFDAVRAVANGIDVDYQVLPVPELGSVFE